MPVRKFYDFYSSREDDFGTMCDALLDQLPADRMILRLVFFGIPRDYDEYTRQLEILNSKVIPRFNAALPVVSYIPQKPLSGGLLLEVCSCKMDAGNKINYRQSGDCRYITIETDSSRELMTGGIMPNDLTAGRFEQAERVFHKINSILSLEGMPVNSIIRQWNYIEDITAYSSGRQNYQEFNRARTSFYSRSSWENGYPAATGIGIATGGVIVEIETLVCLNSSIRNVPVNNSLQVPAHQYSGKVLGCVEDSFATPKFERARMVAWPEHTCVYVSGTAAIRGEESASDAGATEQARITVENIHNLIAAENLTSEYSISTNPVFEVVIIYLNKESDYADIKRFMDRYFPAIAPVYLLADICREELLVEVEAVVSFNPASGT